MLQRLLASPFATKLVAGWVRHAAEMAIPVLIADGVLKNSEANDFLGAVIFLGSIGWSGVEKYLASKEGAK